MQDEEGRKEQKNATLPKEPLPAEPAVQASTARKGEDQPVSLEVLTPSAPEAALLIPPLIDLSDEPARPTTEAVDVEDEWEGAVLFTEDTLPVGQITPVAPPRPEAAPASRRW